MRNPFIMKKSHILVIDDSNTNVVLLEAILSEKGFDVNTAFNAQEADQLIEKGVPDLILLDLLMPGTSGFEFLSQLKNKEKTCNIPVLVISALADEESVSKIMGMGALDYMKKPIDIQMLIQKVESVLSA